jgi:enamine deaminase RidA (YjgF/YER057c/UK114 family)
MRTNVNSGAIWEDTIGYSRAVKLGNIIEVAGTTSSLNGEVLHKGDAYSQTKHIISIIENALQQMDARLEDVVRTRIFLKNVDDWEDVGRAHGEFFGKIKPASTMVAVSAMINPDMLVEIEATAIIAKEDV